MLPAHFHEVDGDLSDHNVGKNVWFLQNSDNDLVTSCFNRDLIGITPSLLLNFMLGGSLVGTLMVPAHLHDATDEKIW